MRVVLAAEAVLDLKETGDWIAAESPARALTFVRELRALAASLARHPRRFPVALRRGDRELRRAVHGNYLVFFELDEAAGTVAVLRIIHGARDQEALFLAEDTAGLGGED